MNSTQNYKITGKQASLLVQEIIKYDKALDWLIASWELFLTKEEREFARWKFEKINRLEKKKTVETIKKWQKNL